MKYQLQVGTTCLVAHAADALAPQAEWLLKTLEGLLDGGKRLTEGGRVQVGWSFLTLRLRDNELVVCEPDFDGDPFSGVREDVTLTLTVIGQQNEVLARVGAAGVASSFQDKIVLLKGCLEEPHIYLERNHSAPEGDSGWYIGPVDGHDVGGDYDAIYVYQLLRLRPELLQVLSLPPGYLIVFDGVKIKAVLDESEQDVWN